VKEISIEFIANYLRIHDSGNPQRPMNQFFEKSVPRVQIPAPEKPMPDYQAMTDQELLTLYRSPRVRYEDRMIIRGVLNKRRVKVEKTL